jgi:hypothetical protein
MRKRRHPDAALIEKLGNTAAVARMFNIKNPSVTKWKNNGIPPGPYGQLKEHCPEMIEAHESGRKSQIKRKKLTTLAI